jgi:translation initiation factor 1
MPKRGSGRVVYSSDIGDRRKELLTQRDAPKRPPGPVKVRREVGGRRGKTVTTVANVPLDDAGLRDLAGRLKKRCGVGGSVKDGVIELQGDHREVVLQMLRTEGFTAVLAGG